jgi:hypothetical protein
VHDDDGFGAWGDGCLDGCGGDGEVVGTGDVGEGDAGAGVEDGVGGGDEGEGGTMTSSPGPMPRATQARWRASVALETLRQWGEEVSWEKDCSKLEVTSPMVRHLEWRTERTAVSSFES